MAKRVSHIVRRPGRKPGDAQVEIPVAQDLKTVPGVPVREEDVSFYSREYPLESQNIEKSADREWARTVYTPEVSAYLKEHFERRKPLVRAAARSGETEPTAAPGPKIDVTEQIRSKARELGFGEVGFARYDRRYTYVSKKQWVRYPHAVCLALEQDYVATQGLPSLEAEHAHFGAYEEGGALVLELADYIRALGYHAQVHSPSDSSGPYMPMFVAAGLGQLGANGQLLSPHFGSRARLMIVTTDARVRYDEPIDYGIHKFCQTCQVCVNRCPGRALVKDKVWWRGAEKNKVIYDRCRPVMVRYEGCGVCIKVCPIQRYGMPAVMEHYVATGQVLGKGTHNLEGYSIREKGYFGPGELPHFDHHFFEFPHGSRQAWLFERFQQRLEKEGVPEADELSDFASRVKDILEEGPSTDGDE